MTAELLMFPAYYQLPLEAGQISLEQAWRLQWELLVLTQQPWTPGVQEISQAVSLFHLPVESMQRQ